METLKTVYDKNTRAWKRTWTVYYICGWCYSSGKASAILYADDMTLYRPIYTPHDYELLQKDNTAISSWISDLYCMQFNVQNASTWETQYCTFSLWLVYWWPSPWKGWCLKVSWGLSYIRSMLVSSHWRNLCQIIKLVGMFHRRFFSSMDSESCRLLYKSYIRPHLECACLVLDHHIKRDIEARALGSSN